MTTSYSMAEGSRKAVMNSARLKAFMWMLLVGAMWVSSVAHAVQDSFTSSGNWTAPAGVTSVTVEAWGGGGGGGAATGNPARGGGGAGGQYASRVLTVVPGNTYAFVVGAGGTGTAAAGGPGGDTSFAATSVVAKGGAGGALASANSSGGAGGAGATTSGVGTVVNRGGNGSAGVFNNAGGAGGGGAGSGGAGGDASGNTAGSGTAGGGGAGAAGLPVGTGSNCTNAAMVAGGGGCGGNATSNTNRNGGAGAAGRLTLTYVIPPMVLAVNRASSNPNTSNVPVSWTVTFSQSVTGVDASDFALVLGGAAAGASITSVTGSGATWTVTAATGTGYGTLGLNVVDNDSIVNADPTPLGGASTANGSFTGQVYTLAAPVVVLSKVASASAAALGDLVTFTITASNPYSVDLSAVSISDVLPTGMTFAAQVTTLGTVSVAGQAVTWSIPVIPANGSAQLNLVVALAQTGTLVNTVTSPGAISASASVLALASAVTYFHLDEPVGSWNGAAGEVLDSGGTGLHGRRVATTTPTTTNTIAPNPTIASQYASVVGGFCNAARFDGRGVVEVPNNALFNYTTKLSASAWIYPTAYPSEYSSILSNDQNYEFHLSPSGNLYWWWGGPSLTSAGIIPLNQWTHIAITFDSTAAVRRQRIYINGVLDANTNNWQGTLTTNPCNFYIGGDVTTGSCALIPARNFRGSIDEVKLYTYELGSAEVQADMTLGRNCSGTYDHIQIEHDGSGSICTPKAVTVKACLNASCSTLYPGNVTVSLSPTGWVGGDTVTLANGIGTRSLSRGTAGAVNLGTTSTAPIATNPTRCFNGGTETCTVNFASASCLFDAVEPAAAPKSRLFTKMAGANFNVDLLALTGSASVNTAYTGPVTYDLVDSSSVTCPATGSGLNTATSVTFASGDSGRKQVVFNYTQAAANVRVRMKSGASAAACSTDNFAIRPASVALATTPAMASGPSATATPMVKAGTAFTLNASTTAGYTGTVTMDTTLLSAQTTAQDTSVAGGGVVGNLSPTSLAVNASPSPTANARYDEVGYVYLAAGAYRDETFTSVDQPAGCSATSSCDCITSAASNNNLSTSLVGSTGKYGCFIGNTSAALGRFVPDHFDTSITQVAGVPMPCPTGLTCPAAFNGFIYSGQAFAVTVTAKNGLPTPGTTLNYQGRFAKAVTLTAWDGKGSTATSNPPASPAAGTPANFAVAATNFTGGVATLATPTYTFATATTSPTDIYIRAIDANAVSSLLATPANSVEAGVKVVSGRIKVNNGYGSERLALILDAAVQYYTGTAWVTSTTDSVTTLSVPATFAINSGTTAATLTPASGTIASGKITINLAKPTGGAGSASIIPTGPLFLLTGNNMTGVSPSVSGLATFGLYKSPLIYRRENY